MTSSFPGVFGPRSHGGQLAPEGADPGFAQRVRHFHELLERSVVEANRMVFARELPDLDTADFLRIAVRVAELRAAYVACALELSHGHPTPEQVARLAQRREAFEEMAKALDAAERLVERGYVVLHTAPGPTPADGPA